MKNLLRAIMLLSVLSLSFYWGYGSHKNGTFPYGLIEGSTDRPSPEKIRLDAEALKTLPYVMGRKVSDDEEREKAGVVVHNRAKAYPGYNLYNSVVTETAYIVDMDGSVVHEWHGDGKKGWHHVIIGEDGLLYVIRSRDSIIALDRDSNVVFEKDIASHHDMQAGKDGSLYVVSTKVEPVPELYGSTEVFSDYISLLSRDGDIIREISMIKAINRSPYRILLPTFHEGIFRLHGYPHILHLNSIDVLKDDLSGRLGPAFKEGNILFSCREINFIGILDPGTESVVWGWGGSNIYRQHHATMLPDGDILMFDNGLRISRALEITAPDGKLAWVYGGKPDQYFYSKTRGSAQRLPNGNTLITVADDCYAIEVTSGGEVVWKYLNPHLIRQGRSTIREAFYRMTRISPEEVAFLGENAGR